MASHKSKEELEEALSKLNEQYNGLLQKNQNDLIKIKQKEKMFAETIDKLKLQKQQSEKKLKNDVNILMLQLEKMKNQKENKVVDIDNSKKDDLKVENNVLRKQNETLMQTFGQKDEKIEHLQQNARKLIDENINLTSEIEKIKKQKQKLITQNRDTHTLVEQIKKLKQNKLQEKRPLKNQDRTSQTEGDISVSRSQQTLMIEKFNNRVKQLMKEIDSKQQQTVNLKQRLKETNQQLKRLMQRDKRNSMLLKKKSEQLENLQIEVETIRKGKTERKRIMTQESCAKCKQWEQENKLLKQMVKSVQTMLRVREMQAQRYKNREALNNSKVHERAQLQPEQKKSKGELPPLGKRN